MKKEKKKWLSVPLIVFFVVTMLQTPLNQRVNAAVNSIVVNPVSAYITQGGTIQLAAVVVTDTAEEAKTVTWTSSDTTNTIVTVDADGIVSAAAEAALGDYIITAISTADSTKTSSATIKVISTTSAAITIDSATGLTAGDATITGLVSEKTYNVLIVSGTNNGKYVSETGTVDNAAVSITGVTSITGLVNGTAYKVTDVTPAPPTTVTISSDSATGLTAEDATITGLVSEKTYNVLIVSGTDNGKYVSETGTVDNAAVSITGVTSITGLVNGTAYKVIEVTPGPPTTVVISSDSATGLTAGDAIITGLDSGKTYNVLIVSETNNGKYVSETGTVDNAAVSITGVTSIAGLVNGIVYKVIDVTSGSLSITSSVYSVDENNFMIEELEDDVVQVDTFISKLSVSPLDASLQVYASDGITVKTGNMVSGDKVKLSGNGIDKVYTVQTYQIVDGEKKYPGYLVNMSGAPTTTAPGDDDATTQPVPLGFDFNYFGNNVFAQAYIDINGYLSFNPINDRGGFKNVISMDDKTSGNPAPYNVIAAFVDDITMQDISEDKVINPNYIPSIYYKTIGVAPNRQFIVQWTNMYFWRGNIQFADFQVILNEGSGKIQLQYRTLMNVEAGRGLGNTASVGLEGPTSSQKQIYMIKGMDSSNLSILLHQGQAICFTPNSEGGYTMVNDDALYEKVYLHNLLAPDAPHIDASNGMTADNGVGVSKNAKIGWTVSDLATRYRLAVSNAVDFSNIIYNLDGLTNNYFQFGGSNPLDLNTTYYWKVEAINGDGSSFSPVYSFTTAADSGTPTASYTISLSETATYAFGAQIAEYPSVAPRAVTVTKTGTGAITNLAAALSGTNASCFEIVQPGVINLDDTTTSTSFTIKPKDGLTARTYTATVTVTADNGVSQSFDVGFNVNAIKHTNVEESKPVPTPTKVTGEVIDSKTGESVKGVPAEVTTQTNGTKTVEVKSEEAILLKQPDGKNSTLTDLTKLSFSTPETTGGTGNSTPVVRLKADGTIQVNNLPNGSETKFNVIIDLGSGQKLVIGTIDVKVSQSGDVSLTSTLIDPYGVITNAATGEVISGANVTLYYANTDRNKVNGKLPDTVVNLTIIDGFKPNNNKNPQVSDDSGAYGWMVFPETDYYIVATRDGYDKYVSPTIAVEQEIVKWDFTMNQAKPAIALKGEKDITVEFKSTYMDPGATAVDYKNSDLSNNIVVINKVNTAKAGDYEVIYNVTDSRGIVAYSVKRTVHVAGLVVKSIVLAASTDSISGSVLASLTGSITVDAKNYTLIKNYKSVSTVYILGGNKAISSAVEKQIKGYGIKNVVRLGGTNAYETSQLIVKYIKAAKGKPVILMSNKTSSELKKAVVTNNTSNYPIVYTTAGKLDKFGKQSLLSIKPLKVYVVGDIKAIRDSQIKEIIKLLNIKNIQVIRINKLTDISKIK